MTSCGSSESATAEGPAAMELYLRVEAARLEVRALRLGRRYQIIYDINPKWNGPLPWSSGDAESR